MNKWGGALRSSRVGHRAVFVQVDVLDTRLKVETHDMSSGDGSGVVGNV